MFSTKFCAVAFAVGLFALPASAQAVFTMPQDKDFQPANMRWSGATAKGYDAFMALKNIDGKLALCGVGVVTNIQLNSAIMRGLRGGTVKLNGKTVLKDFSFFAKAENVGALRKTKANCKSTGAVIPRKIDDLKVNYGKATFRN
ncbi:hypothetical protein BDE40_1699 [Litoreibacter halocynthiae]|uniref:Uncharacterized protein n=1 Tax=Litoreibacter halocynthiae TaxID=1242689 RepID=A0A4R7LK01_9RHOB|nr:hypothetical protein [Litoreibacter halocynthiae]TDT74976.1 hypothetical protein BDE40_1699 [Litoreibacter halocynthiae]